MRYSIIISFLFAFILLVSARNVPHYDPETVAEFNAQQNQKEKRTWEGLQAAIHEWAHPNEDKKMVKRDSTGGAFGLLRDWKTLAEKKFGLVPKN